jgi:hypothetical protein
MEIFGYILPPYSINGFVLPVIQKKTKLSSFSYYYLDMEEGKLILISRKDVLKNVKEINNKRPFTNNEIFIYLRENGSIIIGTFDEIFDDLLTLMYGTEINNYAKISLAAFFQYPGKIVKISREINQDNFERNLDFRTSSLNHNLFTSLHLEKDKDLESIMETYEELISAIPIVSWDDLIYIDEDFIFLKNYKIEIVEFFSLINNANNILKRYFQSKNGTEITRIFIRNNKLAEKIFQGQIENPIPFNEQNRDKFIFHIAYATEVKERAAETKESRKNDDKKKHQNKLKIELKKMAHRFN